MFDTKDLKNQIAVIGVGCRFPGAPDPAAFWRNLRAGADTLSWFNTDQLLAAGWPADLVRSPAFVPVTAVAVGLFSMKTLPPPSLSTMSGKEPGVHGMPVLCGSLALVTAWQVVQ